MLLIAFKENSFDCLKMSETLEIAFKTDITYYCDALRTPRATKIAYH